MNLANYAIHKRYPRSAIRFMKEYFDNKKVIGAEVGVWRGIHAQSILKTLNIEKLYLIDNWKESNEIPQEGIGFSKAKKETIQMIKNYNCIILDMDSSKAASKITEELDFVYIDGNHSYEGTKSDLEIYYEKLSPHGILAGHDIDNGFKNHLDGVTKAVIEFAVKHNLQLYIDTSDWWMVKL